MEAMKPLMFIAIVVYTSSAKTVSNAKYSMTNTKL